MTTPHNETARLLEGLRQIQLYVLRLPQEEACAAYAITDRLLTGTPYHIDPDKRAHLATLGAEGSDREPSISTTCTECKGRGWRPVTEDDGDRAYSTGTQCLRCKGIGEDPEWRKNAIAQATPKSSAEGEVRDRLSDWDRELRMRRLEKDGRWVDHCRRHYPAWHSVVESSFREVERTRAALRTSKQEQKP